MFEQLLKMKNVSLSWNGGKVTLIKRFDPETGELNYHVLETKKGGKQSRFADPELTKAAQAFVNLVTTGNVDGSKTPPPADAATTTKAAKK